MMTKSLLLVLVALAPMLVMSFVGHNAPKSFKLIRKTSTSLNVGPLQKLTNSKEYNKVVNGLMNTKGYTREQAEKEYNAYLDNPNDYALQKVGRTVPLSSVWGRARPTSSL
jgi:hypothetical protein